MLPFSVALSHVCTLHLNQLQEDSESDSVKAERARAKAHRDRLAQMALERRKIKAQLQDQMLQEQQQQSQQQQQLQWGGSGMYPPGSDWQGCAVPGSALLLPAGAGGIGNIASGALQVHRLAV